MSIVQRHCNFTHATNGTVDTAINASPVDSATLSYVPLRKVLVKFNQHARENQERIAHYIHEKPHIQHDADCSGPITRSQNSLHTPLPSCCDPDTRS